LSKQTLTCAIDLGRPVCFLSKL